MRVELFDFELPSARIAQTPVEPRDRARLLHIGPEGLENRIVADLPSFLDERDLLVFNDTKVIPARLRGKRGDAAIEMLLHRFRNDGTWQAFAKPAKKLRPGDRIGFAEDFHCRVEEKLESGEVVLRFDDAGVPFHQLLERHGEIPLPPYIGRAQGATPEDRERYQTLYAKHAGAVAAPTAGLHFTEDLMAAIAATGVEMLFVTLHVGAGTFQPVKVEETSEHRMHHEWGEVSAEVAERVTAHRRNGGRIVAVGTTSLRLLEAASDEAGRLHPFVGETDIFITPGYPFRQVDRLLTNFHLPRSTLFMLVSAFAGRQRMQAAYRHAISQEYRFYSYGDACLIERDEAAA